MHSKKSQQKQLIRIHARSRPGKMPGGQKPTSMSSPIKQLIEKPTHAKSSMRRRHRKSTHDQQYRPKGTQVFKRSKYRCSSNCINLDNSNNNTNPKYSENTYKPESTITWYIESPILKCKSNSKRKTTIKPNRRPGTNNNFSFNLSKQWDIAENKQQERKENLLKTTTESYLRSSIDQGFIGWLNETDQNPIFDETFNFFEIDNNNNDTESSLLSIKSTICDFTTGIIEDKIIVDNIIVNKQRKINNNYYYSLFEDDDTITMMTSDDDDLGSVNNDTSDETSDKGDETSGKPVKQDNETVDDKVSDVKTPKFTKVVSKKA